MIKKIETLVAAGTEHLLGIDRDGKALGRVADPLSCRRNELKLIRVVVADLDTKPATRYQTVDIALGVDESPLGRLIGSDQEAARPAHSKTVA